MLRRTLGTMQKLTVNEINPNLVKAHYAVRGPIVARADEIAQELKDGTKSHPFDEVIMCNIGNPQALRQIPLTFPREVAALVMAPQLLEHPKVNELFPSDVIERAQQYIKGIGHWTATGAYTLSKGHRFIRNHVAKFIENRDNGNCPGPNKDLGPVHLEDLTLTAGASSGIEQVLLALATDPDVGVMIPIPQYPLYTASLAVNNTVDLHYYLDESKGWGMNVAELEKTHFDAVDRGVTPRAFVVINPGNPTGQVLDRQTMVDTAKFCYDKNLVLLSDEVYQENVYSSSKKFHSFREVVLSMGEPYASGLQLASFHSTSKGIFGECGRRGGYMHRMNFTAEVEEQLNKMQSIRLCPNVDGQIMTDLMVNHPHPSGPSYAKFEEEYNAIFQSMKRRAAMVVDELNKIRGIKCSEVEGAMYAFPSLELPPKYVEYAINEKGKKKESADAQWCLELLEETGVVVVPGSGFGQAPGTYHFRTTILPAEDKLASVVQKIGRFQEGIFAKYK